MANPFSRPFEQNAIPKGTMETPETAKRVSAHKEDVTNDMSPMNNKGKSPSFGKEGIKGNGQTV